MTGQAYSLDPRLVADTLPLATLELCEVRLMNDARFAWLVVIPRAPNLVEISDLNDPQQAMLWHEVSRSSRALRACCPCDKLNLGALGNIVRQLHVHVIARREGDAAWPGAAWGCGKPQPYTDEQAQALCQQLRLELSRG